MGTRPESDGAVGGLDVLDLQKAHLAAGSPVQQSEDSHQSLMRVGCWVECPAAKQSHCRFPIVCQALAHSGGIDGHGR
jgi:hypothetical protein